MGRKRATDRLDDVARGLRDGDTFVQIAEATGLSRAQVQNRVATLRIFLAERHDDHRWLTEANTVKVGRAWLGEPVEL